MRRIQYTLVKKRKRKNTLKHGNNIIDKTAETRATIPRVDMGTESISFAESPRQNASTETQAGNLGNNVKKKTSGDTHTNTYCA